MGIKSVFIDAVNWNRGPLGEKFIVFLENVTVGRFSDDHVNAGWQELCMGNVSGGIFEEMSCQLAKQLMVVGGAGDSDGVGLHAVGGRSVNECRREDFKRWNKSDDFIAAVHGLLIVSLCIWSHLDYFFFCHRNCLECVEDGVAEGSTMSNSWMNINQVTDGTCHMMTDGIDCNEDFVFFQPLENGGSRVGALFHLRNGLRRMNDAFDGYKVVRFSRRIVNREEFFKFAFVFREFVVVWIIGVFLIDR